MTTDTPAEWPNLIRGENVPAVTPALRRRFVSRNFQFAYNFHVIYQLGRDIYAVTGAEDGTVVTAMVRNATSQDVSDLVAFLSEYEAPKPRPRCEWFALCPNDAVGVAHHPVLGDVPLCQRCADNMGQDVHPFPEA